MIKIFITFLSYILIFFNTNLFSDEVKNKLKIGLLAPFSGEYKYLGNSLLLSTQLALNEIGDDKILIIPRNSGSKDKGQLNKAIKEIVESGAKIIIGPVDSDNFEELKQYKDVIFISLSNKEPGIKQNIISIGISFDSQMDALEKFIVSQKKKKTIIMYPQNQYADLIEKRIKKTKLKNYKIFKYNSDPKILTGEIEKLTNYPQRKRNLEIRKKLLKQKEDLQSINELNKLEQRYTLGKINFDSVIIIDFGNNLKSVLASLAFVDVNDTDVLFTTVNQWFDESIFYENSVKNLYYPSVNLKNFKKYNDKYIETFNLQPNEITILAYDALGLVYYIWKKNNGIDSINDFLLKGEIKGKIGIFKFNNGKVSQKLRIYKTEDKKFIEY
tara:strand:+ start:120 stop:1274 length:1155 start_codon:yes stop_codon:yes gene_type:complete